MATRPTETWRARIADEQVEVASGELDPEDAFAEDFYPNGLLVVVDSALDRFESEAGELVDASDGEVIGVVRRAVLALNKIQLDFNEDAFSTDGRELLCDYIEQVIVESGVDLDSLVGRLDIGRGEITDEWRIW